MLVLAGENSFHKEKSIHVETLYRRLRCRFLIADFAISFAESSALLSLMRVVIAYDTVFAVVVKVVVKAAQIFFLQTRSKKSFQLESKR